MQEWVINKFNNNSAIKNVVLVNIIIPILFSAIAAFIPLGQRFFIAMLFFSLIQLLNFYLYQRDNNIFLYIFFLNFIGIILAGEISIFFALTSMLRIYFL